MSSLLLPEALPEGEGADDKLAANPEAADGEDDDDEEAPSIVLNNPAPSPNPAGDEDKAPEKDSEEEEEDIEEDDPDSEVQLGANGMIVVSASDFRKRTNE